MRIYIDNVSAYFVSAASLDVNLAVNPGAHRVVIQAWDSTGAVFKASPFTLTVTQENPGPCSPAGIGMTVCSPAAGAIVTSPVRVTAAAKSATAPITAMRIYVDNISKFDANSSSLDTSLALATGTHAMVVQAWDSTGAVFKTSLTIQVQ